MRRTERTYCFTLLILVFLSSLAAFGQGQIKQTSIDIDDLPKGIKYEGKVQSGVRWTDGRGDHIVITAETGEYPSKAEKEAGFRDAELFAYHFAMNGDSLNQTWRVYDFIKACDLDMHVKFIKNTLQITDLNNDGMAEVWLMYRTGCYGDVSPLAMKIIMYHGQQKFAMRGQSKVKVSDNEFFGGDYKFDKVFADGPKAFREFAKNLWVENVMQVWD